MIISVTRQHIRRGRRSHPCYCPIALAMKEVGFRRVRVLGPALTYRRADQRVIDLLPRSAFQFVKRFDDNKSVKPFRFRLPAAVRPS